jgi:hypothetical protein
MTDLSLASEPLARTRSLRHRPSYALRLPPEVGSTMPFAMFPRSWVSLGRCVASGGMAFAQRWQLIQERCGSVLGPGFRLSAYPAPRSRPHGRRFTSSPPRAIVCAHHALTVHEDGFDVARSAQTGPHRVSGLPYCGGAGCGLTPSRCLRLGRFVCRHRQVCQRVRKR